MMYLLLNPHQVCVYRSCLLAFFESVLIPIHGLFEAKIYTTPDFKPAFQCLPLKTQKPTTQVAGFTTGSTTPK